MARKRRRTQRLKVVNPDCAGIDIGKDRHFVAVDPERCSEPVRSFDGFTRDLEAMAAWLSSCGVKKVAMESTSVYWIPVYEVLERAGFEVMLVPPRMTKQIAGRKSDVLDCQWIWQLQSYGLLRGAFRPGDAICPLRSYVRQAKRLIEDRSRCVQHMQKALTQMNVLLDSVLADITGQTGQKILRAIIDGERDPQRLASFRHRRVKASADTIAASLEGTWREEHLFALEQAMQRYDFPRGLREQAVERLLQCALRCVERRRLALDPGVVMLQPRLVQAVERRDQLDPSLAPLRQFHLAGRALDKIPAHVGPTERKDHQPPEKTHQPLSMRCSGRRR